MSALPSRILSLCRPLFILWVCMQNSSAVEFLDETGPVAINFTVSDRSDHDTVSAAITFKAKGLQPIHPDGFVSINQLPMTAKPLQKQGYWYQMDIPKAMRYELTVQRGKDAFKSFYTIVPRQFLPQIPSTLSKSQDLVIRFEGPPLTAHERLYITVGSPESAKAGQQWEITPKGRADGNKIVIPSAALNLAKTGPATVYVGLSTFQQPPGSEHVFTYATGKAVDRQIVD
jgi:hypothetical protein